MASAHDKQKEYSDKKSRGNLNVFRKGDLVLLDTKNLPLKVVSSVESSNLKHRFIGPLAVLARHGAACAIDLPNSMATHPTFYAGSIKLYHDSLGPPSRTEEDQGENSPPRNEAESSGQPGLPVSKPAGTHESHTGMTVQSGKNSGKNNTHKPREFLQGGSRNSAVNAPMELSVLTTKSVQILTKDLKGTRLANLSGCLTTRSQPKGSLDRVHAIPKLTDLVT
ncbi:Pol protein [Phytophthora palmivora]|uniref:Pol protein n=1 Tax=Phytophthora palmivora TaxID=4796 RepID=A0A2P4XUA1_9STRA|nr:Pol protein [Phytophthora palmivora]